MNLKVNTWKVKLAIVLIICSTLIYSFTIYRFGEIEHTIWYILIDLGFIPLDILIVVLFVEDIIDRKEKEMIIEKMDMLMSVFFSEIGDKLLTNFSKIDQHNEKIHQTLLKIKNSTNKEIKQYLKNLRTQTHEFSLVLPKENEKEFLLSLQKLLKEKRYFLVRMLENPNLLEKDSLSDLLLAIFHLDEELEKREIESIIYKSDIQHLIGDIDRVYFALIYEWITHLYYLKLNYPYMFHLALRTNPFDKDATIEILR
ncbi:hypothetical protein [Methanobrevibacter curvatus]|uniref:Uncharacterized protein n=1 Tax=Methanobrevibacter curvatus TaxID=49547 RepID=A0A166C2T4_9EURY|nr:hypothetical protein [Methanobrevibacter curvatus]KZX10837.1 hypothetical protein MBCUR_16350 [Methanobrevibacter curvatus]